MDIEHKLELIQQIHREQEENERYVRQRNYHYGLDLRENYSYESKNSYGKELLKTDKKISWYTSFCIRLLLAVLLFLSFFLVDKRGLVYHGIGSKEIVQYISKNMEIREFSVSRYFSDLD